MSLQPYDPSAAIITSVGETINGGIADSTTPVICGTADAGNTVAVYDGVRLLGSTVVMSDGTWAFMPTVDMKIGSHTFSAIPTDSMGNHGASADPVTVTVTAASLPVPTLDSLTNDQGQAVPLGGTTADNEPTVGGTGISGNTIALYDGTQLIGKATVDNTGHWSISLTTGLVDGAHDLYAIETNATGAHSAQSNHFSFAIDTTTPAVPVVLGVMDDVGPVQGVLAYGATTDDTRPTFFGTGHPGDVITLHESMAAPGIGSAVVAADGTWSVQPQVALPDGLHILRVTATNAAGTTGSWTTSANMFIIDTTTPVAPVITTVTDSQGSVIAAGGTTEVTAPVIKGAGTPGHIVDVYDGSTLIGSSAVDGYGAWSVHAANALSVSGHDFTAIELTKAGVSSAPSAHFQFSIDLADVSVLKSALHVSSVTDLSDAASVIGHESGQNAATTADVHVLHVAAEHGVIDLGFIAINPALYNAPSVNSVHASSDHALVKLSLTDVLSMGERDLFQHDGNQQLLVTGKASDTVDLTSKHVSGLADGEWHQSGAAQVGGVTYNVYEHSGANAELLIQQGTHVALH